LSVYNKVVVCFSSEEIISQILLYLQIGEKKCTSNNTNFVYDI
jgi:hypothetical protein